MSKMINKYREVLMSLKKRYDWSVIQREYDSGLSYRDLTKKFGVSQQAIAKAKHRGDLKTRTISEANVIRHEHYPPSLPSPEQRKKTSKRMSLHNPGGRSKWFEINGKKVQGTWELKFAQHCNEKNIEWQRCTPWKYKLGEKIRNYTPDFYIPSKDLFVEIKGHWWGNDKEKMDAVVTQHPDKKILILEKKQFKQLLCGELVW